MEEVLGMERGEYIAAVWHTDEELGRVVQVEETVSELMFSRFLELRSFMQQEQTDIKRHFLLIGFALWEIERDKLYLYVAPKKSYEKLQGYSSFYAFCKEVFGFKKRTAARLIAVAREFCGADGGIKFEYLNYSYSQLAELIGVAEEYRMRIPITCSVRNIRRLKELYKEYVPKQNETFEDDLKVWEQYHKAEKEKKNAERNKINFIPAGKTVPTSAPLEQSDDDFDGEDERDVITPAKQGALSFEIIRSGLERQLALLKNNCPEWAEFCAKVGVALFSKNPDSIMR